MPVSADLVDRYRRDGFVLVTDLFATAEVAAMKAEIARVLAEVGSADEPSGVFVGLTRQSRFFAEINADPRVVDILRALVGPDVEFLSDKVVLKSAEVGYGSPWHQDWPYWEGIHKVSVWIALDDATPANGCLRFVPGTHVTKLRHGPPPEGGIGFSNRIRDPAFDPSREVTVPVPSGGAVFFHDLAAHASHPNEARQPRWALISTYRDASQPDLEYPWASARFVVSRAQPAA